MRGRKPKPTALKLIEGNKGHRRISKTEPKPRSTVPTCPKHLDQEARLEWKRISRELRTMGLLTIVDRAALAAYCQSYSRWVAAESCLAVMAETDPAGRGLVTEGSAGPVTNPLVRISRDSLAQMRVFLVEFGLTPSSRTRLEVKREEEMTLAEILA